MIMPKTGRNIYKRKDGRWEGRYIKERNINGKLIYGSVYGKTCTEVKQRLSVFTVEESASPPIVIDPTKHSLTFADVVSQWLSVISLKVKPSTYAGYIATLDLHILPSLGKRKMNSLTAVDISRLAKAKLENGRTDGKGGLSSKTVRDILSIIKAIVDFACNENIISNGFTITYPKQQQRIPQVPKDLTYENFKNYPEAVQAIRDGLMPVGYDISEAILVSIKTEDYFCYVISGSTRTGKTNAIRLLTLEAVACGHDVYLIDNTTEQLSSWAKEYNINYLSTSDQIYDWLSGAIVDLLQFAQGRL